MQSDLVQLPIIYAYSYTTIFLFNRYQGKAHGLLLFTTKLVSINLCTSSSTAFFMVMGTRLGGILIGGAKPVVMRCGMMSQNPRSERDFEKTLACFRSRVLTDIASS